MNERDANLRAACPHCRAVFALSQAQLDARGGLIRCNACSEVFDATWHLLADEESARGDGDSNSDGDREHDGGGDSNSDHATTPAELSPPPDGTEGETPRASPLRPLLAGAVAIALLLVLIWQINRFVLDEYAQHEQYRRHLAAFCAFAGCELPLRRASARITLTHTRLDRHPLQPGAMRITVKLVNEATFAQPYPDLQLTLNDRDGRVVGRRAFSPEVYLQGRKNLLESGELGVLHFDLARTHGQAVGFEVDIVSRAQL